MNVSVSDTACLKRGTCQYALRAAWAENHEEHLAKLLKLKFGVPSRDAIRRTLQAIRQISFQKYFLVWIDSFRGANTTEKELVAVDGKTLRCSCGTKNDIGALHIVTAWSSENGIALGQTACEEKSNEIMAIPELPDQIDVTNSVVTIDAMGTQKKIADKIVAKKAGCILAVKENQKNLYDAVKSLFRTIDLHGEKVSRVTEREILHGKPSTSGSTRSGKSSSGASRATWSGVWYVFARVCATDVRS